jgi:hypothetical protein
MKGGDRMDKLNPEQGYEAPLQEYLDSTQIDMDQLKLWLQEAKNAVDRAEAAYKAILAKFQELIGKIKG